MESVQRGKREREGEEERWEKKGRLKPDFKYARINLAALLAVFQRNAISESRLCSGGWREGCQDWGVGG